MAQALGNNIPQTVQVSTTQLGQPRSSMPLHVVTPESAQAKLANMKGNKLIIRVVGKQLIFQKQDQNGVIRDMTDAEVKELNP